ncbi:MAG: NfeD family protein [Chitinophagales bacterium]
MTPFLVFAILFFGVLLFVAEVFLLPSGILGKIGFVTTIVGLVFAYKLFGFNYGTFCVLAAFIVNGTLLYFGADRISKSKMAVQQTSDGKVNIFSDFGLKVGDKGQAITDLRPEGKALFNDNRITIWSFNGFIDANTLIEVVQIKDNKIFVQKV